MLASGWEKYSCTSIVVACELRYGAAKKQSSKLTFNVEQVLASLPVFQVKVVMPLSNGLFVASQDLTPSCAGILTGALTGAQVGLTGIPQRLLDGLEESAELLKLAEKLAAMIRNV